jgi:hypothetical protein
MSYFPPIFPPGDFIDDLRFHAEYRWDSQRIDLRVIHYHGMGGRAISLAEPLVMKVREIDEHANFVPPTLSLRTATAQHLMDQLWQCGLRPTEGTGSAGSLAATQRHLDDMRKIAFTALEINEDQTKGSRT